MRPSQHPRVRTVLLALCGVGLAAALVAIILAVTVASPSRNLRPLLASVDAMYVPVYVSMAAAGILILAAVVAIASALHGNRAADLTGCVALLTVSVLALATIGLTAAIKTSTEATMEATLAGSLIAYGPGNASIYKAWDDMQNDLACCAVRTNFAQDNYQPTPWYRIMREGNPHGAPRIPNSCCNRLAQRNPSLLSDCTTTLPSLPAQNANLNRIGCFEAMLLMTDAFTIRYIILSVILFLASGVAFGAAAYHLVLVSRAQQSSDEKYLQAPSKLPAKFGYANHAAASATASNASLSRGSLASLPVAPSASRTARSPAPSVYSASNSHRSLPTRQSPTSTISNNNISGNNNSKSSINMNSHRSSQHSSPAQSHANSAKAESLPPSKPVALAAQPIRSSGRGRQLSATNQRGTAPQTNQRAALPGYNHRASSLSVNNRAISPPDNQRPTSTPANQRATSPPANQRATSPPTNKRATSPPANQRATTAPANHGETLPKANQGSNTPTNNQTAATLPTANQRSATAPGAAVRQSVGGQQSLTADGKRESHF